jgi:hypothetical protein
MARNSILGRPVKPGEVRAYIGREAQVISECLRLFAFRLT